MARLSINEQGNQYGKLTVLEKASQMKPGKTKWLCQCICGNLTTVVGVNLRNGSVKSCGCLVREVALAQCHRDKPLREFLEYGSWLAMKKRCLNKKNPDYPDYGGRGITIEPSWIESFDAFYKAMGPKPSSKYSLERTDVNGHYAPGNVVWATPSEQSNNKRNCVYFEMDGESLTLPEIARRKGLNYNRLYWYTSRGMDVATAVLKVKE
jgi:hypothetical protein